MKGSHRTEPIIYRSPVRLVKTMRHCPFIHPKTFVGFVFGVFYFQEKGLKCGNIKLGARSLAAILFDDGVYHCCHLAARQQLRSLRSPPRGYY